MRSVQIRLGTSVLKRDEKDLPTLFIVSQVELVADDNMDSHT